MKADSRVQSRCRSFSDGGGHAEFGGDRTGGRGGDGRGTDGLFGYGGVVPLCLSEGI